MAFWIFLGLVGAFIAGARGGGCLISLACLALGPFGIVLAFVVRASKTVVNVNTQSGEAPAAGGMVADELKRLADLHEKGVLSDREFARQKRRLLK